MFAVLHLDPVLRSACRVEPVALFAKAAPEIGARGCRPAAFAAIFLSRDVI
jgi:hypothetical protein